MQQEEPSRFGFESTADDVLADVDLSGKAAVVTGASGGLGAETARALAARGAAVVLTARDEAKAAAVVETIRAETPDAQLDVVPLELGSIPSVRACAEKILALHPALDILINNAGIMACPLGRTEAGHELQIGTNHLGHFLLTGLLAPALVAGAPSRVVCVSSAGHRFSPVVFEDVHYEQREYDKWGAYGQAKTANVLHAVELDRRLRDRGVRAFAIHPGGIMTELGRHMTPEDIQTLQSRVTDAFVWKKVPQGAATQCFAATAPELEGRGGLYLEDCHIAASSSDAESTGGVLDWALDPEAAERLWPLSEEWVGEKLPLA